MYKGSFFANLKFNRNASEKHVFHILSCRKVAGSSPDEVMEFPPPPIYLIIPAAPWPYGLFSF
jgi:hypothetical protein